MSKTAERVWLNRVAVLGTLLLGLSVAPLGCELITGDVSHDFAGAGGVPAAGGEAGEPSMGGSVVSDGGKGGTGASAGSPEGGAGASGAGGAGDSNGMAGDGGAAGMAGSCGAGACVACNAATDCPGSDDECKTRTCISHQCSVKFTASGTAVSAQTAGNCLKAACDGAGNVSNIADGTDPPPDDGNACTDETCAQGVPQHPAKTNGVPCSDGNGCTTGDTCQGGSCSSGAAVTCTALDQCHTAGTCNSSTGQCTNPLKTQGAGCSQSGGSVCTAAGACVQCLVAADCPGSDTECQTRTCVSNTCGVNDRAPGTPTSSQTAGDCLENECDGSGHSAPVAHDADVPVDDGNQCTSDLCSSGVAVHPKLSAGTACNQTGGSVCDGGGSCTSPAVASASPGDSVSAQADTSIAVTFNVPMAPATLTAQTTAGPCAGSIQVSADGFTSCVGFASAAAVMSANATIATLTPAPALQAASSYKIRVTTAAQSAGSNALGAQFTQPVGFTTP